MWEDRTKSYLRSIMYWNFEPSVLQGARKYITSATDGSTSTKSGEMIFYHVACILDIGEYFLLKDIVLNALWSCFFHLLHKFVTNIAQSMHATNNLGYILSVIPCIAHPWDWHLKASCVSEGKMVSLLSDIWKQATFLKQREIIAFNTVVIQENIFLVHNDNSLLYEVWYREAWFYWYFY